MLSIKRKTIILVISSIIFGCSSSNDSDKNITVIPKPIESSEADRHFPFSLPSNDQDLALNSFPSHVQSTALEAKDIMEHPDYGEIVNNELIVNLSKTATVLDVRNMLDEFSMGFKSTIEGSGVISVILNKRKTSEELTQIKDELENKAYIDFVVPSYIVSTNSLPLGLLPSNVGSNSSFIDHHLAVNAHGAWNVQAARQSRYVPPVKVIVTDDFTVDHGYMVEGVISGGFSNVTRNVKGIYPEGLSIDTIDFRMVGDIKKGKLFEIIQNILKNVMDSEYNRPIIVNASWGRPLLKSLSENFKYEEANKFSNTFLSMLRTPEFDLENKFLIVAAGGNHGDINRDGVNDYDDRIEYFFPFGAPRLLAIKDPITNEIIPNATNIIMVENFIYGLANDDADKKPVVVCMSEISYSPEDKSKPGHIGAIGTNVYSYTKNQQDGKYADGTSFAAPQVTGLAASIWDINPTLLPHEVIDILQRGANTIEEGTLSSISAGILNGGDVKNSNGYNCKQNIGKYKVIDAYRSLLLLDKASSLNEGEDALLAPVRVAALDGVVDQVTKDMIFNEKDIQEFTNEFSMRNGRLDYSKFDLNGDGRTGGGSVDKFDLNMNGTYDSFISNITYELYDESKLTDIGILCYYSYSNLYSGDKEQRDMLLPNCTIESNAKWFASDIDPTYLNRTIENNYLLNPPTAEELGEELILNSAVFTDHQSGNLFIQVISPFVSGNNIAIGFDAPTQTKNHVRIQYCLAPDSFVECWESVSGTATIEMIDGNTAIVFNDATFEMYFDKDGIWLSMEEIRAGGTQIIDSNKIRKQQYTGKLWFTPSEPSVVEEPSSCDSVLTLLVNPIVNESKVVTAEPPLSLPSYNNPLACNDPILNNTSITILSGLYSDSLFGDVKPWYEIKIDNESSKCPGVVGFASVSNISFSSQVCGSADALLITPANTGILVILDSASLFSGQRLCASFSNTSVKLGNIINDDIITSLKWRGVEVLNGPCKGKVGFVDETVVSPH